MESAYAEQGFQGLDLADDLPSKREHPAWKPVPEREAPASEFDGQIANGCMNGLGNADRDHDLHATCQRRWDVSTHGSSGAGAEEDADDSPRIDGVSALDEDVTGAERLQQSFRIQGHGLSLHQDEIRRLTEPCA